MKNIILIGYMGCGKSSVGKLLAKEKQMNYQDLDDYIENKEGYSIKEIFSKMGEVYFRKIETKYLNECLSSFENTVLSLGGGTPCFGTNMEQIISAKNATCIYLQTSVGELAKRLFSERHKRPLITHINTLEALAEFIAKHIFERSEYYLQSKFKINTDNKTITEIVSEINNLPAN